MRFFSLPETVVASAEFQGNDKEFFYLWYPVTASDSDLTEVETIAFQP